MLRRGGGRTARAGARDGTKVVDEVSLGHANTRVAKDKDLVGLVRDDLNLKLGGRVEDRLVLEGLVADLVEGLQGISFARWQREEQRTSEAFEMSSRRKISLFE